MNILFLIASIILSGLAISLIFIGKENIVAFSRNSKTPATYMHDGIDHYVVNNPYMIIRTIALASTPAILISVVAAISWGSGALIAIPLIGIIVAGPLEYLVAHFSWKNDGRKVEDLFDRIYGLSPGSIIRFLEHVARTILSMIVIYGFSFILMKSIGFPMFVIFPLVLAITYYLIVFQPLSIIRKVAVNANITFALVTFIGLIVFISNTHLVGDFFTKIPSTKEVTSINDFALFMGLLVFGSISYRSIDNAVELVRNSKNKKVINDMVVINRVTTIIITTIWTIIAVAIVNNADIKTFEEMYLFDQVYYVISRLFGWFTPFFAALIALAAIAGAEVEMGRVRHALVKFFDKNRLDSSIKVKSAIWQSSLIFFSMLLFSYLGFEIYLLKLLGILSLALITFYLSALIIYVWKVFGKLWSLIPLALIGFFTYITSAILIESLTFGLLESQYVTIFGLSMVVVIIIGILYRISTMSTYVKMEEKVYVSR